MTVADEYSMTVSATTTNNEDTAETGLASANPVSAATLSGQLEAFGSTFVLAPTWSLRVRAEDNVLLSAFVEHDVAVLLQSEMQARNFNRSWREDVAPSLCADARRVYEEENAGGSSVISETMSMELFARAFNAKCLKTEMQLAYFPSDSAMTDFAIELDGVVLGVSVTRAPAHFTLADAERLLQKKLGGVLKSTAACYNAEWRKQILHIWARTPRVARLLEQAYSLQAAELVANTLCLVTYCGSLPELFTEKLAARPFRSRKLKGAKDEQHLRILQESDPIRFNNSSKL